MSIVANLRARVLKNRHNRGNFLFNCSFQDEVIKHEGSSSCGTLQACNRPMFPEF